MRPIQRPLLALGLGALVASLAIAGEETGVAATETARLSFKAYPDWTIILPRETWSDVGEEIPISHARGSGFLAEHKGDISLEIDTNGDGKLDEKVRGIGGFLKLKAKTADGQTLKYAVRIRNGATWQYSVGGAMTCKLNGQVVRIIDQDNNGRYDDYGSDAMVIGTGNDAALLSKVVNLKGELFEFEVSSDGSRASIRPFTGETGVLEMSASFKSRGKLMSAVVEDSTSGYSFNLAGHGKGLAVPAGAYSFVSGFAAKGAETAWIRTGRMRPIQVEANGSTHVAWGAPVVADFTWSAAAGTVTVNPDVAFYGQSGEEYHSFAPNAKSPKLVFKDKRNGKTVLKGRFPGC